MLMRHPVSAHYRHPHLAELPLSLKALYTNVLLVLALGYIFGLIQIFEAHGLADGQPGLSISDIQIAYRGNRSQTQLEGALRGTMSSRLDHNEASQIITWIHDGLSESAYHATIKTIFDTRCVMCHSAHNTRLPDLTRYDKILETAHMDTGPSVGTLVRVSHIHLFGLTFIFAFLGHIFSHAYFPQRWVKSIVITIPFFAIFVDIASWWLTRVSEVFGYIVIISGALMALAFALQWSVSIYQMWLYKTRADDPHPVH